MPKSPPTIIPEEYAYELRIPKERIAILIGKSGEIKKQLEKDTESRINVDSEEGIVQIKGANAIHLFALREIIRAIGRGFNPEIAKYLLKQDYALEVINLSNYTSTQKELIRLRGRIIGEGGKARNTIETLTNVYVSVFGKTVSILGSFDSIALARKAVEQLLSGSPHSKVYYWLERKQKEIIKKEWIPNE
ncbi:RNA-processing protein [Candidatus Woesearchaeota archaeon]|nr:RNA-processing protein [Candidatus Woesearchaeota archaeon]